MLEEVAPEIPVCLDTPKRKDLLFNRIQEGIGSGNVWIALDRDNQVVGFLLAEPDRETLELSYGGVRTSHRGHHIFPTLVKEMMAKGVTLTATVMHSNKSNMLNRLSKLGFTKVLLGSKTIGISFDGCRRQSLAIVQLCSSLTLRSPHGLF